MKKRILFLTSFLAIAFIAIIMMPNNVFAAIPDGMSDEFKAILNEDGELVVTDSNATDDKELIISDFINKLTSDVITYGFAVNSYTPDVNNENLGVANIARNVWEDDTQSEAYDINVVFDEQYGDIFKQIFNGDEKIVITDTFFDNEYESGNQYLVNNYVWSFSDETYNFNVNFPNENDDTICVVDLLQKIDETTTKCVEQHVVNVEYNEIFSELFQQITTDGNLVITDSSYGSKTSLIQDYCDRFMDERYMFYVNAKADESAFCIELCDYESDEWIIERHVVNVTFEEKFSDEFKKIFNNGDKNILITSTGLDGNASLVMQYIHMFGDEEYSFALDCDDWDAPSNYTVLMHENNDGVIVEQHAVNVTFEEKFSDEFKKIFNNGDGKIVIKTSRDYAKNELFDNYCWSMSNDEYSFYSMSIDDDETQAVVVMQTVSDYSNGYYPKDVEQHIVDISYDKAVSTDFKSYLNSEGKFVINSVKPNNIDECYFLYEILLMGKNDGTYFGYISDDFSSFDLTIIDSKGYPETHKVDVQYNYDEETKKAADELMKDFPGEEKTYMVRDMELVNYWLHVKDDEAGVGKIENYSSELREYVGYKNFNFMIDTRLGADNDFFTLRGGIGLLKYGETVYHINPYIGVAANHILYVPDDTESTKEALRAAVQKRVDEYVGEDKVKIVAGEGTIEDYYRNLPDIKIPEYEKKIKAEKAKENPDKDLIMWYESELEWYKECYDEEYEDYIKDDINESLNDPEGDYYFLNNAEGGFWFTAVVNGENYQFIVAKDSKSMINPTHKTVDLNTNVQISTTSTSVPLDTLLNAKKLTNADADYKEVLGILKEKATEAGKVDANETYDLKLYSNSLGENITKLNDGTFEVKLPTPEKFKGKNADDLKVYYVDQNDNDKIYTYDVKFEDNGNYIVFITDHFSIYTLSEKLAFNTVNDGEEGDKPITGGNAGSGEADPEGDDADKNDGNDATTGGSSDGDKNNDDTPQTGDNVLLFVGLVLVSVVGIAVSVKVRSRKK